EKVGISFNYLGQFDSVTNEGGLFAGEAPEFAGWPIHPANQRPHYIDIVAAVTGGKLHISWLYSNELFLADTIKQVADDFMDALCFFLQSDVSAEQSILVPSDFPEADLSQ